MQSLGQLLLEWRLVFALSQAQAAKRCGLSQAHWSLLEGGQRTALRRETFLRLAAGTDIPLSRLTAAAVAAAPIKREQPAG
jgi:transcriptional regulator with XRE-family HTH domain